MGDGICGIFDRGHGHFGMPDHAWMVAARHMIDLRFRTCGEFVKMSGGMTLSASPITNHEGIVFQPTSAGALSVRQRAAKGRCVAARRAATSGDSADAKTTPKYFAFTY